MFYSFVSRKTGFLRVFLVGIELSLESDIG